MRKKLFVLTMMAFALASTSVSQVILLTEKGDGYSDHIWFAQHGMPSEKIKEYWNKGWRITTAGYTSCGFTFAMAKGTGYGYQTYTVSTQNWPNDWVKAQLNDKDRNLAISSIIFKGQWVVVCTEGTGYRNQQVNKFEDGYELKKWLETAQKTGRFITNICYGNHKWIVVSSQGAPYNSQNVLEAFTYRDAIRQVQEKVWGNGMRVHHVCYGDGRYMVVYGAYSTRPNRWQRLRLEESSMYGSSVIEDELKEGGLIVSIGSFSSQKRLEPTNEKSTSSSSMIGKFQYNPEAVPDAPPTNYPMIDPSTAMPPTGTSVYPTPTPSGTQKKHGMRDCPGCNGSGYVYDSKEYGPRYTANQEKEWCEQCRDYDYSHYHKRPKCKVCGGSGKVVNPYD